MGAQLYQFAKAEAGELVNATAQLSTETNTRAFAAWAAVYDEQKNPLLSLEERFLSRILPDCTGKHVADVGCGTGRWLTYFSSTGAASLYGLDNSKAMLEVAKSKHLANARLIRAELPSIPIEAESTDLGLASFVFSYVADIDQCASELARVIRTDGDLFVSDMHPDTAAVLGWNRGFSSAGQTYQMRSENRPIAEVVDAFVLNGFSLAACLEPHFGRPERDLFLRYGKSAAWSQAEGMPPIYLLHFRRSASRRDTARIFALHGAHCALGPSEQITTPVAIQDGAISSMLDQASLTACSARGETDCLDLRGYLLLPGFVNAHDHLEFALFPRLGSGPYANATEWAKDIQTREAETIALHKQVPKAVRLWWGGVRNLLSGVTTVCHHNPLHPSLRSKHFPVRVLQEYGWGHSVAFGGDIPAALQRTSASEPFLIHACEGIDQEALEELTALDAMSALDSRTILIHGLALEEAGAMLLNHRGAALVICPSSNDFLFQKTHSRERLQSIDRLALGSDSPLTAAGDLLDELRFAYHACDLPAERLYEMVTRQSARILRLRRGEGSLRVGATADLVAIRHRPGGPAEILTTLTWRDVELVIVGGHVRLASKEILQRLPSRARRGLTAINFDGQSRWLRGPVHRMLQSAEDVLGAGNVRVGGLPVARTEL
ncbi:MAG TPA: methyltransferase domain-containing protein [Terracidiphilus sp.]|nr:methyltransferase domain-containing protein [Terracidiphilus sp.]